MEAGTMGAGGGRVVTTAQAAEEFGVTARLIEQWVQRRLLAPVAPGVYREADVAEVEKRTRRGPRARRLAYLAWTMEIAMGADPAAPRQR